MNNDRRARLNAIIKQIEDLNEKQKEIAVSLDEIFDEENASYDNMPESLQTSEKGQLMQSSCDALETAIDLVASLDLDEVIENINKAMCPDD